jgi:hypothetical protein
MLGAYEQRVNDGVAVRTVAKAADRIWGHDATFWGGDADRERSVSNRLGWLDVAQQMRERIGEIDALPRR